MQYPWCVDLCMLVEKREIISRILLKKDGKFDFSDLVTEDVKIKARELAY